jgi:lysozyme
VLQIVSLSSHNAGNLDFVAAAKSGISGVVHKATQGTVFIDSHLPTNRDGARAASLPLGYYHFGTGDDGREQADYFLTHAKPASGELLALIFEENPSGNNMTLTEAQAFVGLVHERTRKWPVLFGGSYLKREILSAADLLLANCPLWLSQYGHIPILPRGWKSWALWDQTNSSVIPGLGRCDILVFEGNTNDLAKFWKNAGLD